MPQHEYAYEGTTPEIHPDAAVSEPSTIIGNVTIQEGVTVWPGAVLRGDIEPVSIGAGSAIGDNAVIHGSTTGERALVGHCAVLNEAHVGDQAMIGFNATISGATVGERSLVAMGTAVPDGCEIPPESFARGTPPRVTPLDETEIDWDSIYGKFASGEYAQLTDGYENLF